MAVREPFFAQLDVRHLVQEVAEWDAVTLYVGAGASIDRTGLSWAGLVDGLLAPVLPEPSARSATLAALQPLGAATAAVELLARQSDEEPAARLRDRLRLLLYGSGPALAGQLTANIAELAFSWFARGKSVCIVTPNYDDFLLQEFANLGLSRHVRHVVVTDGMSRKKIRSAIRPNKVTVVHLHGFLPRSSRRKSLDSPPVLSEVDYFNTIGRSRRALSELFRDRDVLMFGTSLSDAPLLRALYETKRSGHRRVHVSARQSGNPPPGYSGLVEAQVLAAQQARAGALGVEGVLCDYYMQASQLAVEIASAVEHTDQRYADPLSDHHYGRRLGDWWREWSAGTGLGEDFQRQHHTYLRAQVANIRRQFGVPRSEALKMELWVRWRPDSGARQLTLWASSTGTWPDRSSMRSAEISAASRYASVRAFCNGAPTFATADGPEDGGARWSSYLSVPLWLLHWKGQIPVGVITISSMADASAGLVSPGDAPRSAALTALIRDAGDSLVFPRPTLQSDGT